MGVRATFDDFRLNSGRIIRLFFHFANCQPEAASDVIYGMAVQYLGVDVHVKFGYSRSNCSLDIRLPHLAIDGQTNDERTNDVRRSSHKAKTP